MNQLRLNLPLKTWLALPLALLLSAAALLAGPAHAAGEDGSGAGLRERHAELADQLNRNIFQRALYIDSAEAPDGLKGDAYAVLDHPFATVRTALGSPANWCDVLILPFNTKYCRAQGSEAAPSLMVRIGRKSDQPLKDAYPLTFAFHNVASGADYFESRLAAETGPLGTRDYRIMLAATPLDAKRTFIHLSYSYGHGAASRLAMQSYLATIGAGKVGFTQRGRNGDGEPVFIDGVRGAVERNAMRYYLAIDAYLDSLNAPLAARVDRRIQKWFTATEQYPRQLREMDRPTYVAMKRSEHARQQSALD